MSFWLKSARSRIRRAARGGAWREAARIACALGMALVASACATLPQTQTEVLAQRAVEHVLIEHGGVPVVFESGLAARLSAWSEVYQALAPDTTLWMYNRPGYGASAAVNTPRDGMHVVEELRAVLAAKGLRPPYVLVGHSLGGLYMQYYARRYPDEVAGLVLVDSTHPDQMRGKGAPEHWPMWLRMAFGVATNAVEKQELAGINDTGAQVLALPTVTGPPVLVLTATQPMQDDASELAIEASALRRDFTRLYPAARQVWVDSGHDIPRERPDAIIAAVRAVLAASDRAAAAHSTGKKSGVDK